MWDEIICRMCGKNNEDIKYVFEDFEKSNVKARRF